MGDHVANLVETQVVNRMKEITSFPGDASGLLGGASMAKLVGLTVARNTQAGFDVRTQGCAGGAKKCLFTLLARLTVVIKSGATAGYGNRQLMVSAGQR